MKRFMLSDLLSKS